MTPEYEQDKMPQDPSSYGHVVGKQKVTLNDIGDRGQEWTKKKGFWETHRGSFSYKIWRIVSHAKEAYEVFVTAEKEPEKGNYPSDKLDGTTRYAEKLADAIIEAASFMRAHGIDVDAVVKAKMDYNDTRTDKQ